jgi:peptidoglycan/xylan/chitin deacetylase (PgdA/CDA1 family)
MKRVLVFAVVFAACSSGAPSPTARTATTTVVPSTTSTTAPLAATGTGAPITNGSRSRHAVALTFDSNLTDFMIRQLDNGTVASFDNTKVIDILDQYAVSATFFLAGKWMERYPDTTRRLASDSLFELGSHSYAHLGFTDHCYQLGRIALDQMAADVERSEAQLRSLTPKATRLFRFPGGCYDNAALAAIAPTGVTVIQYDLPSGDAFGTNVNAIVQQVLGNVRNGSIVVMHVTGGSTAPHTADALPSIIVGLRARGYQLETVTQLLTTPAA